MANNEKCAKCKCFPPFFSPVNARKDWNGFLPPETWVCMRVFLLNRAVHSGTPPTPNNFPPVFGVLQSSSLGFKWRSRPTVRLARRQQPHPMWSLPQTLTHTFSVLLHWYTAERHNALSPGQHSVSVNSTARSVSPRGCLRRVVLAVSV